MDSRSQGRGLPGSPKRILAVDDDELLVELYRRLLRSLGYQVTACTRPEEALEAFLASPGAYDLLLTDQSMPWMTGKELASRLREVRPDVPVVLCTGEAGSPEVQAADVTAVLGKPFEVEDLAETLRRALDGRAGRSIASLELSHVHDACGLGPDPIPESWRALAEEFGRLIRDQGVAAGRLVVRSCSPPIGPTAQYPPTRQGRFALEATFGGQKGMAFSAFPGIFEGTPEELLSLPLDASANRALFLAAVNAVARWAGLAARTLPCPPGAAEHCARELAEKLGTPREGTRCACVVGNQPCLVEALRAKRPVIPWTLPGQMPGDRWHSPVLSATEATPETMSRCQTLLVGGMALVLGGFDEVTSAGRKARLVTYGATISGAAALMGWEHHCPYAR